MILEHLSFPMLLVTLPDTGDVQARRHYPTSSLQKEPMVTWHPAGGLDDRFCLLLVHVAEARTDVLLSSVRLLWLVAHIPGAIQDVDSMSKPVHLGLAGNHDAVSKGVAMVAYEPPCESGSVQVILFRERPGFTISPESIRSRTSFNRQQFAAVNGLEAALVELEIAVQAIAADSKVHEVKPLAYASGGDLIVAEDMPTTLTAALLCTANKLPEKGLTIYDNTGTTCRLSFSDLYMRAMSVCAGLQKSSAQSGSAALLQLPRLEDHFAAFWGCLLQRIRPVAVAIPQRYEDGNHAVCKKLHNTWCLLDYPPVITTALHVSLVGLLPAWKDSPSLRLLCIEALAAEAEECGTLTEARGVAQTVQPAEVAFMQLSSGSTGVPKCIQITHGGVVAHIHGEAQFCSIGPNDIQVNFLPVDHVVPILTVHCCDVYHGCEEVQADVAWVLAAPLRWLQLIAEHGATRSWSPNFAFKLIADALRERSNLNETWDLACCRYWMNAGEQVTLPVCEDFLEATAKFGVGRNCMQPAFGMAEACTCMTYNNEFALHAAARLGRSTFIDLGPPVPGVEIRIADDFGRTVSEDVIGRFQIRGAVVTPGYWRNPEANQEALVEEGWLNTGDVGFMRHGRLCLTGREKEMIIVRGANFYCYEVEDIINALPCVRSTFTAAVSAHDPVTGTEGLAVFFVPQDTFVMESDEELVDCVRSVRSALVRCIGLSPSHVVPLQLEEFPKTTSGKIQRRGLARALQAGDFDERLRKLC